MNDPMVIVAIVITVAVIAIFIILGSRITGFRGRFTKKGMDVDVKAAQPEVPPAMGVDLSGSKFKDDNKPTAAPLQVNVEANLSGAEFRDGNKVAVQPIIYAGAPDSAQRRGEAILQDLSTHMYKASRTDH